MPEFETAGVQGNPAAPKIVGGRSERGDRSVLGIAQKWVSTVRGLNADLVHPARFQVDFQPRTVLVGCQNAVMEHRDSRVRVI
jgi:hypothetical protein